MSEAEIHAAANAFAMELLMPRALFLKAGRRVDLNDDEAVAALAKKFKVTVPVATLRLAELRARTSQEQPQ